MERTSDKFVVDLIKGVLIGVSICLALVLVFAFVLKFVNMSSWAIRTVNQVIKLVAVLCACAVAVKGEKGFLKGSVVGLCVVGVTFLTFGLLSNSLSFGLSLLWEALYGIFVGLIGGIIAVNLKK